MTLENFRLAFACSTLALIATSSTMNAAEPLPGDKSAKTDAASQTLQFSVRVIDDKGNPVSQAKVFPWALRSSQGHGLWPGEESKLEAAPKEVMTDDKGIAVIDYPVYYEPTERVRATAVSVRVDHPKFAFIDIVEVEVPRAADEPHPISLVTGVPVEVRPRIEGEKVDLDQIYAVWSDGRSWRPGVAPEKRENGSLRLPALPPGRNSLLLAKVVGDRATHFSRIVDFQVLPVAVQEIDVTLRPAVRISGTVSDNVPRPVRRGRISIASLSPDDDFHRVWWLSWTTIAPNGAFVIDSWPAGEPIQMIGLCDGYIAASGTAPAVVKNAPDVEEDLDTGSFRYPQVFESDPDRTIALRMQPMGRCVAIARDRAGKPIPDLAVSSWPNIQWWNGGSQLYGSPLMSSLRVLKERDPKKATETGFPTPFQAKTGADGKATLELPLGTQSLYVTSDAHELPIADEQQRHVEVEIEPDKTSELVLPLQPRGTQRLGE